MYLMAPIGGEELCRRQGRKCGDREGVSGNRKGHLFRKSIKEAGIDLGF